MTTTDNLGNWRADENGSVPEVNPWRPNDTTVACTVCGRRVVVDDHGNRCHVDGEDGWHYLYVEHAVELPTDVLALQGIVDSLMREATLFWRATNDRVAEAMEWQRRLTALQSDHQALLDQRNELADALAADHEAQDETIRRLREAVGEEQAALQKYRRFVRDATINYPLGCPDGKWDFLETLGFDKPRDRVRITFYLDVPSGAGSGEGNWTCEQLAESYEHFVDTAADARWGGGAEYEIVEEGISSEDI